MGEDTDFSGNVDGKNKAILSSWSALQDDAEMEQGNLQVFETGFSCLEFANVFC